MKTFVANEKDVARKWYLVDAADKSAGRLAVEIARVLRGKHRPTFTPHVDTGDFVVVINVDKVKLTGAKEEQKLYKKYTGYPDGLKQHKASTVRAKNPSLILSQAVKGMLPKNNLSRQVFKRLKIYAGPEHPHAAQNPEPLEL